MIDYEELREELAKMQPRQKLYELIKTELSKRGRWKSAPRGKSFDKGLDDRRKGLN